MSHEWIFEDFLLLAVYMALFVILFVLEIYEHVLRCMLLYFEDALKAIIPYESCMDF